MDENRKLKNYEVSILLNALRSLDYEEIDGKRKRTAYKFGSPDLDWTITKNLVALTVAANAAEYARQKLLDSFIPTGNVVVDGEGVQKTPDPDSTVVLQPNTVGQLKYNRDYRILSEAESELKISDLGRISKESLRAEFNKIPRGIVADLMLLIDE